MIPILHSFKQHVAEDLIKTNQEALHKINFSLYPGLNFHEFCRTQA